MKIIFTAASLWTFMLGIQPVSGAIPHQAEKTIASKIVIPPAHRLFGSPSRSIGCDTLLNIMPGDSLGLYTWQAPSVGYEAGNAANSIDDQGNTTVEATTSVGEYFLPGLVGSYVTSASVFFGTIVINTTHNDSVIPITAYVYDATDTDAFGALGAPGHAYDSVTTTLGAIAAAISDTLPVLFSFPNQPLLPAGGFFITILLPQVAGDSIALVTTGGTTGLGRGWVDVGGFGWSSYPDFVGGDSLVDDYIVVGVCGSACPSITTTAAQIAHTTAAHATASGGTPPYTYRWSDSQSTDTATGLVNGSNYTVTAYDANGCSGIATVSISTGIEAIGDISNFTIYPNPSNGVFTTSIHLAAASDVTISIADVTGAKVYETIDTAVKDLDKQINLDGISAGIYFVNVKTAQGTANQRIVIK